MARSFCAAGHRAGQDYLTPSFLAQVLTATAAALRFLMKSPAVLIPCAGRPCITHCSIAGALLGGVWPLVMMLLRKSARKRGSVIGVEGVMRELVDVDVLGVAGALGVAPVVLLELLDPQPAAAIAIAAAAGTNERLIHLDM